MSQEDQNAPGGGRLRPIGIDLHMHTVLSACAEVEMIPPLIVAQARRLGLGMIAVTDHNAIDNAAAVIGAVAAAETAEDLGPTVLPGMELQTAEEVHLICLFETLDQARGWQEEIWRRLPPLKNREATFGPQFVVDAAGEWVRTEERLLATSAAIDLDEAVAGVHELGGLAIAAHVDRPTNSLIANLGFVPEGLAVDGLEVTGRFRPEAGLAEWPSLRGRTLLVGGDAHRLSELARRNCLWAAAPSFKELALALRRQAGRRIEVDWS